MKKFLVEIDVYQGSAYEHLNGQEYVIDMNDVFIIKNKPFITIPIENQRYDDKTTDVDFPLSAFNFIKKFNEKFI